MGIVQVPECDVFKTRRNVQEYTLTLTRKFMGTTETVWSYHTHLSPRGERRCARFVKRGLTPPGTGGEGEIHEIEGQEPEPSSTASS